MILLPCPMCSAVLRQGVHRVPCDLRPSWMFASNTSRKHGKNMWCWSGCVHAQKVAPDGPVGDGPDDSPNQAEVEEKWQAEARRLLEIKTLGWTPAVRDEFELVLGFKVRPEIKELP